MKIQELPKDEKTIKSIEKSIGEGVYYYATGERGVTKIVAYYECGSMAAVPWIAVYKDDEIFARMDCTNCVVIYKDSDK